MISARHAAEKAADFYRRGIARIEDRGAGDTGEQFRVVDHVYADDLDLFGKGGVFELLCTARTPMGRQTLARWLLAPAPVDEIRERQQAIDELRSRLDLREDLAITGNDLRSPRQPDWLVEWAESPVVLKNPALRVLAAVLALAAIAALVYRGLGGDWIPLLVIIGAAALISSRLRDRADSLLDAISAAADELALVSALLARIEREPFTAAWLRARAAGLESSASTPSRSLARLRYLADLANARNNLFVKLIDVPLLYSVQVAFAAESWRRRHGHSVRQWLDALGDLEALVSLSAYAFEHPDDTFPEFLPERVPAIFDAERLGTSAPARRSLHSQPRAPRRPRATAPGKRLEHERQEHAAARHRRERDAGAGGRTGSGRAPGHVTGAAGDLDSRHRLAAGRPLRLLR